MGQPRMTYFQEAKRAFDRTKVQAIQQAEAAKLAHARAEGGQMALDVLERNLAAADAIAAICAPRQP